MKRQAAVLLVDDEPGMRDMLSLELTQEGFEVETAADGAAAIRALKRRKFDLAITDLRMPGRDGAASVQELRELDPEIEVIVTTACASVETAVACMKRGAYDYVPKPFDVRELVLVLERAAEKRHLQCLVALYEASRELFARLKHDDLVSAAVELAQRVLRADDAALVLWRGTPEQIEIHRSRAEPLVQHPALASLARRAAEEGAAIRLPSSGAEADDGRPQSTLVHPLYAPDRWLGALVVVRRPESPRFSPFEVRKGTIFANQLALSLENARLHEQLEAKIIELVATREQLLNAEKLALAGKLAGAVAHEVNNPLSFVLANLQSLQGYASRVEALWLAAKSAAQVLRNQPGRSSQDQAGRLYVVEGSEQQTEHLIRESAQMIREILEGVNRIADLVAGFTHLAALDPPTGMARVDVGAVIDDCIAAFPSASARVVRPEGERAWAWAARDDLKAALWNLMTFLLAPERRRPSAPELTIRTAREADGLVVEVTDASVVLTEEDLRRMFDPHLELDARRRTLRLNMTMALTYQLLRRNGAELTARRADGGQGLAFRFHLARRPGAAHPSDPMPRGPRAPPPEGPALDAGRR